MAGRKVLIDEVNHKAPPLTDEETKVAVANLVHEHSVEHIKVVRSNRDPAIPNQLYANVSTRMFEEPKVDPKTGVKIYGLLKVRGVWESKDTAEREAEKLVQEVDSSNPIFIAPVGFWGPISNNAQFSSRDLKEITKEDNMHSMHSDLAKEKEKKTREVQKELKEREEAVRSSDIYDDPESLEYYAMRRVTDIKLYEAHLRYQANLEKSVKLIERVRKELKELEVNHPEYIDSWNAVYDEKRSQVGLPPYVPDENYIQDYESKRVEDYSHVDETEELERPEHPMNVIV